MQNQSAKQALQNWATDNGVTPAAFAEKTGFSYQHAWNLLKGSTYPTDATLGRFVMAYGAEAAKKIAAAFVEYADMDGAVIVPPVALKHTARPRRIANKPLTTIPGVRKGAM
jgi:transcriptional regulator with XRE-family HTH domain